MSALACWLANMVWSARGGFGDLVLGEMAEALGLCHYCHGKEYRLVICSTYVVVSFAATVRSIAALCC